MLTPFLYTPVLNADDDYDHLQEVLDDAIADAATGTNLQVVFVCETHRTNDESRRSKILQYAWATGKVLIVMERGMIGQTELRGTYLSSGRVEIESDNQSVKSFDSSRNAWVAGAIERLVTGKGNQKKAVLVVFGADHAKYVREIVQTWGVHVIWHEYPSAVEFVWSGPKASDVPSTFQLVGYVQTQGLFLMNFFMDGKLPPAAPKLIVDIGPTPPGGAGHPLGVYIAKSEAALIRDIAQYVNDGGYGLTVKRMLGKDDIETVAEKNIRLALKS